MLSYLTSCWQQNKTANGTSHSSKTEAADPFSKAISQPLVLDIYKAYPSEYMLNGRFYIYNSFN